VTADSLFAGEVCEFRDGWDAAVLWIGEAEAALEYIAWLDPAVRAVLLVDGRTKPLAAMGLVDRALGMNGAAPFVLFVAEQGQLGRLAELDDGEVNAFLPAPLQPQLLVNALHTLPLRSDPGGWQKPAAALTDNSMPPLRELNSKRWHPRPIGSRRLPHTLDSPPIRRPRSMHG
jgi:hypothetical protein